MRKDKEHKKRFKLNTSGLFLFLLIAALYFCVEERAFGNLLIQGEGPVARMLRAAICLLLFCFGMWFQTLIHETGHLLGGKLTGYRFASLRVGKVMLVREKGKFYRKSHTLPGTSGQCLMMPPPEREGKFPYVLYHMGGCFANLIVALLFVTLYFSFPQVPVLSAFLIITAAWGIAQAVMNGIPLSMGRIHNDGYSTLLLLKSSEARRAQWLQLQINGLITNGVRLKDMPSEWFDFSQWSEMDSRIVCNIGVLSLERAVDCMDFEKAQQIAGDLLQRAADMSSIGRGMVLSELLYCKLIAGGTAETVESLLTEELASYIEETASYLSTLRVEYAYALLAQKDEETAQKLLELFEKRGKTHPHACETEGERELLTCVQERYALERTLVPAGQSAF